MIYYQNNGGWVTKHCNETDILENTNKLQLKVGNVVKDSIKKSRTRYGLTVNVELSDVYEIPEVLKYHVDWGGISRTPLLNSPREILNNIAHRLFLGSPHIGGNLSSTSIVDIYTEIKKDGHISRAHPCYSNKGCWYDWVYFNWYGYDNPIPA